MLTTPCGKEQAREKIARLVDTFRTGEAHLRTEAEAQIENNYLRPLFRCLNWNTENAGLALPDYEFVLQRTDRRGKRPDYVLQLDGQHLLVMDAKQVKYEMHDPRWMNQVYGYAYSTQSNKPSRKIDFAILTDFQEFLVLDCTLLASSPQAVGNFRVLDWRYQDYLDQFDTLWDLFERENLRQAALTRGTGSPSGLWARALSPAKVKANRVPPDKAFLAALDDERTGWRVRLAKDMKKHNPQADGSLLTAAVQLLIDRLVFVKVLSDREIEDDYLSQLAETVERDGLAESDTGWFAACRGIFDTLNQFYNGSVFAPSPELESVAVSNKVVRDILRSMQPEYSPYNFAVLPVEILGTIYERFLGRVVRTTEKQVRIEDKPEVRKAGGVYYTPQYIVDCIVQNTVGKLLEKCRTPEDVARLRILDPACGSGSFLLGAYAALIDWHIRYYVSEGQADKRDRTSAYYDSDGNVRLTARLKRQILLNNLYGVDIDAQAVEVTRFSLSLKALEGTRRDELYEERDLFKQTVLPDLRGNIKCGNSLIGPHCFSGQMFVDKDELRRVNPFDWAAEFPAITAKGGFDAVIGNPPYIRIQTMKEWAPLEVELYKRHYRAASQGNYDIYVVFVEKGLSLLNPRGRLGFILPHKFFNSQYGQPLRELIAAGKHLEHVVHFGDQQVFAGAITYTCLLFLHEAGSDVTTVEKVTDLTAWQAGSPGAVGTVPATRITGAEWNFAVGAGSALFERLGQMPVRLGHVATVFVGLQTSADTVFLFKEHSGAAQAGTTRVLSKETGEWHLIESAMLKSVVRSGDIGRYTARASAVALFPYEIKANVARLLSPAELQTDYPLAWAYLNATKSLLQGREEGKFKDSAWYRYGRNQNLGAWEQTKLMVPYMVTRLAAYYDRSGELYFVNITTGGNGVVCSAAVDPTYLCGLLNSRLLNWYFRQVASTFHGGYFAANRQFIGKLPIMTIDYAVPADVARHDRMVALVDRMLELHKFLAAATTQSNRDLYQRQIDATDRHIDALVYALYGLTPEEIAIVEGSTAL